MVQSMPRGTALPLATCMFSLPLLMLDRAIRRVSHKLCVQFAVAVVSYGKLAGLSQTVVQFAFGSVGNGSMAVSLTKCVSNFP